MKTIEKLYQRIKEHNPPWRIEKFSYKTELGRLTVEVVDNGGHYTVYVDDVLIPNHHSIAQDMFSDARKYVQNENCQQKLLDIERIDNILSRMGMER